MHIQLTVLSQYENLLIDFPSTSIEHSVLEGDDSVGDNSEILLSEKFVQCFILPV